MPRTVDVTSFFDQEAFSDITVKFGTKEKKCHKIILCSKSEYFTQLCGPGRPFAEAQQPVIELKDDNEEAVEAMLRWLYTFDYEARDEPTKTMRIILHCNVCIVADKYLLPGLLDEALGRFRAELHALSVPLLSTLIDRTLYKGITYPSAVVDAVKGIQSLRFSSLIKDPTYRRLMRNDPDLAMAAIDRLSPLAGLYERSYGRCGRCGVLSIRDKGTEGICSNQKCLQLVPKDAHKVCWVKL